MLTGEALEIVLKMARSHLAFMADLADNFDMNSSDNRPFNTLEAEAIEEVEFLLKGFEDTGDYTEDDYMEERY
jgi:hypothetical protein